MSILILLFGKLVLKLKHEVIYLFNVWCMADYMLQKLGMEAAKVLELCHTLYKTYGTTMAGLRVQFNLINLRMNCLKTLFLC
jgi:hypothetical protein